MYRRAFFAAEITAALFAVAIGSAGARAGGEGALAEAILRPAARWALTSTPEGVAVASRILGRPANGTPDLEAIVRTLAREEAEALAARLARLETEYASRYPRAPGARRPNLPLLSELSSRYLVIDREAAEGTIVFARERPPSARDTFLEDPAPGYAPVAGGPGMPAPSEVRVPRSVLEDSAARTLRRTFGWPVFQARHFAANATEDALRLAASRPPSATTYAFFGTTAPYDAGLAGTLDELTNPKVALEVFARSFGRSEGYVNVLSSVPRRALQPRFGQPDTLAYEQAYLFVEEQAGHRAASEFVTHSIPSRRFASWFESCCERFVLRTEDPAARGIPVMYINPAYEEEVNRALRAFLNESGEAYRVATH